ncbi:MAG: hypothetical protein HY259_11085 [Chloroflexi bacterium]|nr:hypothetical protein [Chloroflexota bacterium]
MFRFILNALRPAFLLQNALPLLFVTGLMAGFTSVGAALFTSTTSVAANSFTTGTVDIATSPTSALVTFTNMAPGDVITAPVTVSNNGTLQLRYAITSTITNADSKGLGAQLQLTIKSGLTTGNCAAFVGGTTIYGPATLGSLPAGTSLNLVGDPTTGAQSGDRTLVAAANEVLCFQVSLPLTTGNAFQNATSTATFAFIAEQTVNN